jgi:hypothetical protein
MEQHETTQTWVPTNVPKPRTPREMAATSGGEPTTRTGGPAFPNGLHGSGMTLRDWYIGQMAPRLVKYHCDKSTADWRDDAAAVALCAVIFADALLAAREGR